MKKKPEQYTRAGKSNVTLRNFLNNLKENDLHFENNQITQCVFLGVLRLKPVPTIFSSNNTSSDSSPVVESKPRRFRNNNCNKEGNKNISRKKDINKVISGKIRKKNPEKIKASVKKVPVQKPIIKVKLNMKKKTPNTSPSKEPNIPNSDLIEERDSLHLLSSPPIFNPVDNLFSKLKKQIEHSQPGPSGVLPQGFVQTPEQTSVCKINVNRQLTYPVKSKKPKKLGKKRSIIHERLAMPLLPHESVSSSDSSCFKEDLTSPSSHTSSSPISEQDLTTATSTVVTPEVPKALKQKERISPRNKGESKTAANDEEVVWINSRPIIDIDEDENLLGSDVIVIPDSAAEVPCRNPSRNNVIIIDEPRGPRLSPRSKKTQETSGSEPNINSKSISKPNMTQSDVPARSLIFDVDKPTEKQTTSLLKPVEPTAEEVEAEKSFDKPRRRRRLMPTAIPSIFFNTPMLLRSELAQKKPSVPEKKPVARGLPRLLRSELNKLDKPPKARNSSSQMSEEASASKLSKPAQKNYKQNDNLIYEVVKPAGVATTHTSNVSESSCSSGNEVIFLEDAPPKVEPLIIKLKVSQQKNFETAQKTKGAAEAAKDKPNSCDNSDSMSVVSEKFLLKPQMSLQEDTKNKETGHLSPQLKSDTHQLNLVKCEIAADELSPPENVSKKETAVLPVKLQIDTSNRISPPKVASPKKPLAKITPKMTEINLVQEKKQETEVVEQEKNKSSIAETMKLTPLPKPVENKVQKDIEFVSSSPGNKKEISIAKLRENTRRLLRPENFCPTPNQKAQKTVDSNVILIPDEPQASSDCIDVTNELPPQKDADVVCLSPKESAKSKDFKMSPLNQLSNKKHADQEVPHIKSVPEIIDLCSVDQTDAKESKKSSDLEKRITIHSDFKLQFIKNEEPPGTIKEGDNDKNGNTTDNINDINENLSSKATSKLVNSKESTEKKAAKDSNKTVKLNEKSSELEQVKLNPKTTRRSVAKEQLVTPKTDLTDKNIYAKITAPIKQLAEKVKTEELDTVDLSLENSSVEEPRRTLRSEMVQQKWPVKSAEIKKTTEGLSDQTVNKGIQKSLEITKTSPSKLTVIETSRLLEIPVVNTVIPGKIVEKTAVSNKEPEAGGLPQRLLRSDKCQQKLLEDNNKNILPDAKNKPPKLESSKQAKKTTAQADLITELGKNIDQYIKTLRTDTDKESPKTDRSRSSIGQKSQKKQENLDEIIVLGEKKAKKPRESTRLLRSSLIDPLLDSESIIIKSEIEKVVVLIHNEPKTTQSSADTGSEKGKVKEEVMFPRSLRSQKTIANGPPVQLKSRRGRKPASSVGNKRNLQDSKLKTAIKSKTSMKTVETGVRQNKKSNAPKVLTKNGASMEAKKKIPITKKVTRQKLAQPLRKLRQRAVTNAPKKEWLPAKVRADKLKKQLVAKNKKTPKAKKPVEWKNNEIIEKIIQEIRNTIFQDDTVEGNLHPEAGNISSEENSPKENIVPAKKKAAETGKVPDKKKKVRRPSLKEIRNTKNTRVNLQNIQRGRYKTRQGNQTAKTNPKLKAPKTKPASKRASQRVAQKVTKEDLVPDDPSPITIDSKEDEVPNKLEPKIDLDEANEADNETKNTSDIKETYQMVNSFLEEIVEDEDNKTQQLKRKSVDLEHEVVARKQSKVIPEEMEQSCSQLNEDGATVPKDEATVLQNKVTVLQTEATVVQTEVTVVQTEDSTDKAAGKAKRRYKKRTFIQPVEELPTVDVDQSNSQLRKIGEDNPTTDTLDETEIPNEEVGRRFKTDEVKQDGDQLEAKRQCRTETVKQCKTEFVRILEKLVKEMMPTEDPPQGGASSSAFDANAKMADVIKRLCVDDDERRVQVASEVLDSSSKKADITVFDFDESDPEPEVAPLRHKASPEKPAEAAKDKLSSRIEQPAKEVAKKAQRRPVIKEENAKTHDESQTSTVMESEGPKKMWSRIEQPTKEVAKKAPRRQKIKEECSKTHDEPKTSADKELESPKKMWSRIEVPTERNSPKNKPRKSLEVLEVVESPQGSPTKPASPMKQPTIIEMFNKVRLKLEQGGATADTGEDLPAANRAAAVPAQSRVSVEEGPFGAMPPPKTERANLKAESVEDDDSDCESRAEWIPEEYAEYKMKYSAQKMMQYKPVFKCKVCLKVLPSYYRLTKHRKEHELRDNPYECRECEADFSNIDELTAHLRVHKGKYPYTCSKCSVGFWTKKAYDAHAPIHVLRKLKPPVKKFRCDVCAKEFSKLCDIDRHMRVHTGEKPCVCNICNKGFQQSHNLSKHLLTHLHIRPFHCEICDKQFGRGDVLARHVLTHSIDKPIKCWVCHKGFIRQTQLVQHHQKYHRDRPLVKPEPEEGAAGGDA